MTRLLDMSKRTARRVVDRIARPYVDEIIIAGGLADGQAAVVDATDDGTFSEFFHMVNHELRTVELERIPKGARRALSVGAQGRWYFDWFEQAVGPLERHIGIEAFEPQPDDLPDYVTWIPDTADHMNGVRDGEVDLVYAGQTSEHLWAGELSGFLTEAHRVLSPEGLLVLDSPNRLVTEHLYWSHGGHTVELSADEIGELLRLAGFDVRSVRGLWRYAFEDGRVLQLEDGLRDGPTVVRRVVEGADRPDDSFVWWAVARRADRDPDTAALRERTEELFDQHWAVRVNRGLIPLDGRRSLDVPAGASGVVRSTLPFPLHTGTWRVSLTFAIGSISDVPGLSLRIVAPGDHLIHELRAADAEHDGDTLRWLVEQPYLLFALQLQMVVDRVERPVSIHLPIDVRLVSA